MERGVKALKWESVKPFKYFCNRAALRTKCIYVDIYVTFVIYGINIHQVESDKQEHKIYLYLLWEYARGC